MALTKKQAQEYNRAARVSTFFKHDTEKEIVDTYEPLKEEVAEFEENFGEVQTAAGDKEGDSKFITETKEELKQEAADLTAEICSKTKAFALKQKKTELAGAMSLRSDEIVRLKDGDVKPKVEKVVDLVKPLLTDVAFRKYAVTQGDLDKALEKAILFAGMIGKADEEESHSTVANTDINDAIKKLGGNYEQFDLLMDHFEKSHPEFVEGYEINSRLDNTGVRHSGIEGRATAKDGEPLEGVKFRLLGTDYETVSDLEGLYRLVKVKVGTYRLQVSCEGYVTVEKIITIKRGKVVEMNWELVKG